MTEKRPETAAELMARLNSDPEFAARRHREDAERQARAIEWQRAEIPLVEELRAAGLAVDSVWDLVNTSTPYPDALPILADHLQRTYPDRVREGIARALAVPQSKFAWDVLTRLFREEGAKGAKDGLAVAISVAADDAVVGEVIDLVRDKRHGSSRILLLSVLERSDDSRARAAFAELASDAELKKEVRGILGRIDRRKR